MEATKIKSVEGKENIEYCREICNTIYQQISLPNIRHFYSWGANKFVMAISDNGRNEPCLQFKVSGMLFKGYVRIFYNASDYYDIELVKYSGRLVKRLEDIDAFSIQEVIDNNVEKIDDYVR